MEPLVNAGPAIEMAAECNHRLVCEFQANVAVEASRSHFNQWAWFSSNYSAKAKSNLHKEKKGAVKI